MKPDMSHSIKNLRHFMVNILKTLSKGYGSVHSIMRMFVALKLPGASCHVDKYSVHSPMSSTNLLSSECHEVRHQNCYGFPLKSICDCILFHLKPRLWINDCIRNETNFKVLPFERETRDREAVTTH